MPTRHYTALWYRDEAGGMHWRCQECGEVMPTLTPPITADATAAWQAAAFRACPGDRHLADTPHQVSYIARAAFTAWIDSLDPETLGSLGLAALIVPNKPYDTLSEACYAAYGHMGTAAIRQATRALLSWKQGDMTEGTACKALGVGRVEFRGYCHALGLVQDESPVDPDPTPEYPSTGPAVLV